MADSLHPALKEAEKVSIIDQSENSVRKLRRPKTASQDKKKVLKSSKKRYTKILGSWTAKTRAYVKMVSGGKMAPWSLAERKALLDALKKHSHQDWDTLCRVLPERSKEEIQKFIDYLRGSEVSRRKLLALSGISDSIINEKCTADAQLTWLPIESWLDMCQEMVHYEQSDLSTLISRVFSMIGNFSKFPEVTNPYVQPDYAKIYRYIAAVLDDSLSLPELSPLESAILVDLTHGLGDQLRMSDTTLQRKVMCWKYKMLNHKFDFLDVKGSVERIRKALTNDFSDMQKQSQHPAEVLSPLRASTSQSGDSDTNTSKTLGPSSSQQSGNEIPAAPQPKKRGRRPKDTQAETFKYLEKPRLYSMNPFCVPIRLLKLKPLLAENGGLGRFSIHRQDSSSSVTHASMPETRIVEETSSQLLDKDQDEGVQKTAAIEAEQNTIRELAGVCLKKVPLKRRKSAQASPRPLEACRVGKNAPGNTRDTVETALGRKVGGKVSSVFGAQATVTCEAIAGGDFLGSPSQATVTCETIVGRDPLGSGAQTSVICEASLGTSKPSESQRAALPSVSVSRSARATEEKEADEKQPDALKVVRAFRCVHSQAGQLLLVPIKLGPTAASGGLAPGVSQNTSQQQAKPLQIAARPVQPLQIAARPMQPLQYAPRSAKPLKNAARLTKTLQSAARPVGSKKFQSSLTVSSSLFRSPLRAPIVGCSVSCGPDKSSGELQWLSRPYSAVVSRQPEAKRKATSPAANLSDLAKRPRTQSQDSSRTFQDLSLTPTPHSTERGTDSEQEILSIEEMCKADRLKAKLLAAVYADQKPSKKLHKDKTKTKQKKIPKTLLAQLPKRRRGRPPGSGQKQKLAGSGQQSRSKKKLGRPVVKSSTSGKFKQGKSATSTSGTFKQGKSATSTSGTFKQDESATRPVVKGSTWVTFKQGEPATRPAAMATNTAAVASDTHGSNGTCISDNAAVARRFSTAKVAEAASSVQLNNPGTKSQCSGTPVIRSVRSETSKNLAAPVQTATANTDGPVQARVFQSASASSRILPLPGGVVSKTGQIPEIVTKKALNGTGVASLALGQKASLNRTAAASLALEQKTSLNSTDETSPALRQKASLNSTGETSPALRQKASLNSTGETSPALRQKASFNSTGTASPALRQKASFNSTGTASPALRQKASLNSTGAISPTLGQTTNFKTTERASPALGQKASFSSTGAVCPAPGQKASRNSTGTASPSLGQKASFKAILAQVASPHTASTHLSSGKTQSCSAAMKNLENCAVIAPAADVSGTHASPSFHSAQLPAFKTSLSKKRRKPQEKSDFDKKQAVAPAACVSGTQTSPLSASAPYKELPNSETPLPKKMKKAPEKSDFAKKYTGAKLNVKRNTHKPRPIDSVDLSKANVVYVSLDDARQRVFSAVQNSSDRPGSTIFKVHSEKVNLVSI